jgi:hypothetical protein
MTFHLRHADCFISMQPNLTNRLNTLNPARYSKRDAVWVISGGRKVRGGALISPSLSTDYTD